MKSCGKAVRHSQQPFHRHLVHIALQRQGPDDDSVYRTLTLSVVCRNRKLADVAYAVSHRGNFFFRIDKIACPTPHKHIDRDRHRRQCGKDVIVRRRQPVESQFFAKFNARSSGGLSTAGIVSTLATTLKEERQRHFYNGLVIYIDDIISDTFLRPHHPTWRDKTGSGRGQ